jgi:hypothetical protein
MKPRVLAIHLSRTGPERLRAEAIHGGDLVECTIEGELSSKEKSESMYMTGRCMYALFSFGTK